MDVPIYGFYRLNRDRKETSFFSGELVGWFRKVKDQMAEKRELKLR